MTTAEKRNSFSCLILGGRGGSNRKSQLVSGEAPQMCGGYQREVAFHDLQPPRQAASIHKSQRGVFLDFDIKISVP